MHSEGTATSQLFSRPDNHRQLFEQQQGKLTLFVGVAVAPLAGYHHEKSKIRYRGKAVSLSVEEQSIRILLRTIICTRSDLTE